VIGILKHSGRRPFTRRALVRVALLATLAAVAVSAGAMPGRGAAATRTAGPIPALAYYYIWYDASSWNRAKTTYPLLGRYSSDDVTVMRRHVRLAREAGLDGFIVSWKSTPRLNRRLAALIRVADAANFKLAIIYQGLDFHRDPLPVARVARDMKFFARIYGSAPAFDIQEKPIVIWSGSWEFSRADVARVARQVRPRVLLLASEKSVESYRRLAGLVDGDAYYWSSVDPATQQGYAEKLQEMSSVIHQGGGLWIAPAAPGFDARLVGGTRVIPRLGGETLRREWSTALSSSPDMIGLISWNEFSENSEVEPSEQFGATSLQVVHDIVGSPLTIHGDFDSTGTPARTFGYGAPLLVGIGIVLLACVGGYVWRRAVKRSLEQAV
jgi:Glycosyl hydrolase family 71